MYDVTLGSDTLVQSTCWHSDKPSCLFHDKTSSRAEVLQRYLLFIHVIIIHVSVVFCGPGSSVGKATAYGLDRPGIESRWDEISAPVQTGREVQTASCEMDTGSFPGRSAAGAWRWPLTPSSAEV